MFSHHSESTLKTFGLFQTHYPPLAGCRKVQGWHWYPKVRYRGAKVLRVLGTNERARADPEISLSGGGGIPN